jgi:hypothetical protein
VTGWPWNTTVVARLAVTAALAGGTSGTKEAIPWIRLRCGRMADDHVLEDAALLGGPAGRLAVPAERNPHMSICDSWNRFR